MVKGKDRFFSAVSGFEPKDELELCQSLQLDDLDVDLADEVGPVEEEHSLDERQRSLTGRSYHRQISTLHEFLEDGIGSIEKVPFSELRKDLRIGDQIWIYRDRRTNPCNPVAVLMPYAHVAVFVGDDKVVHVTKAPCSTGILTATIKKVPIDQVIKPYDKGKWFQIIQDIFNRPYFSFSWPQDSSVQTRYQHPRQNRRKSKRSRSAPIPGVRL